jgi:hypothetical protein
VVDREAHARWHEAERSGSETVERSNEVRRWHVGQIKANLVHIYKRSRPDLDKSRIDPS